MAGPFVHDTATEAWKTILSGILSHGVEISPRGMKTKEIRHLSVAFEMSYPAIVSLRRRLSTKFMAAEPLWILSGSDRVADIDPYCKQMKNYSDDGETLWGAYGPPVVEQLPWVVEALSIDPDTRQAVLTIWRRDIEEYYFDDHHRVPKDVPCTVAMVFQLRKQTLHVSVFMRSSDAWLGVPYDFFTFSIIAAKVAYLVNRNYEEQLGESAPVRRLGILSWTAASSHLYEPNFEGAADVLRDEGMTGGFCDPFPHDLLVAENGWEGIERSLRVAAEEDWRASTPWLIKK